MSGSIRMVGDCNYDGIISVHSLIILDIRSLIVYCRNVLLAPRHNNSMHPLVGILHGYFNAKDFNYFGPLCALTHYRMEHPSYAHVLSLSVRLGAPNVSKAIASSIILDATEHLSDLIKLCRACIRGHRSRASANIRVARSLNKVAQVIHITIVIS